jgi:hypothetical protein
MTHLKRFNDWPERLSAHIHARMKEPFIWGQNDCCLFAMDCVKAITGEDLAVPYRGYTSQAQALRLLKKHGGIAGIAEAVAHSYAIPEITPVMTGRGDVCLFDAGYGDTLGICTGANVFAPAPHGLASIPTLKVNRAWRIG